MTDTQHAASDPNAELPPPIQQLIASIKGDRKRLLKEKAFDDPAQLKQFLAQYILPRMVEMTEMFGEGYVDSINVSLGNANKLQRLHAWARRHFETLDIDADDELPGFDSELLSEMGKQLHGLGALLAQRLPEDQEVGQQFNVVVQLFTQLTAQLMADDDDDDADDDDDDDADDKEPEADKPAED